VAHTDVPRLREQDLARLVMDRGLAVGLLKGAAVATVTGSAITPQTLPRPLAEQIAGAVYAALGNVGTPNPALPAGWGEGSEAGGERR